MPDPRPTEAQCQRAIIDAAKIGGWMVHAGRAARTEKGWRTPIEGVAGFPDLVLVHPTRHLIRFVELKRKPYKPTAEQRAWIAALNNAHPGSAQIVWVPEQMPALIEFLTHRT